MQRAKHAKRRMETRNKIVLGGLVIKAGAGDLSEDELVAVLSDHMMRRAQSAVDNKNGLPEKQSD